MLPTNAKTFHACFLSGNPFRNANFVAKDNIPSIISIGNHSGQSLQIRETFSFLPIQILQSFEKVAAQTWIIIRSVASAQTVRHGSNTGSSAFNLCRICLSSIANICLSLSSDESLSVMIVFCLHLPGRLSAHLSLLYNTFPLCPNPCPTLPPTSPISAAEQLNRILYWIFLPRTQDISLLRLDSGFCPWLGEHLLTICNLRANTVTSPVTTNWGKVVW